MKYKIRFLLFFAAMILFNLAANFAHPVTPTLIQNLSLPDYMFGLMLAMMLLSNFLFSPFWGKINTAISSRTTLLIGCLGYAVAQLGFAYGTTQGTILFVRILAGIFVGGAQVSFLTYVINMAKPEDQGKFLTYSATIQSVFGAFGYLVGGLLGELSIRATFLLQAGCLAFAGILFYVACLPDNTVTEKLPMKQIIRQSNPLQAFLDGKYFMTTAFVLLFAVNILTNFGNTGFDQVFNYYLKDQLNLTSSYNGLIKAAVGFISLLVPQIFLYIGCSVLVYAGYSVSLPVLQDMVAQKADPAQKNLVMGFYNATKSLGSIIGSLMAGFLYGIHVKLPFFVVVIAYGVSILAAIGYLICEKRPAKAFANT